MIPDVSDAVRLFEETVQFQIVVKTVIDGQIAESSLTPAPVWFEGTLLPMSPRELLVKPEGERKFKWWMLFTDIDLHVDWVIKDQDGSLFRVMNSAEWGGYNQYQLVEGPGI